MNWLVKNWWLCPVLAAALICSMMVCVSCSQIETVRNLAHDAVELSTLKVRREAGEAVIKAQEKLINEQLREERRVQKLRNELSGLRSELRACRSHCSPLKKRVELKEKLLRSLVDGKE